jgi:proteasome beta subunit
MPLSSSTRFYERLKYCVDMLGYAVLPKVFKRESYMIPKHNTPTAPDLNLPPEMYDKGGASTQNTANAAEKIKTGTTTVGIVCKDGVVLATEHRATGGTMIMHKKTQKLFRIDDNIGMTVAGLVGDAQLLVRLLTAEVELYMLKRNGQITIKAAATLMSNILSGQRIFPFWVGLLIGGWDREGGHVYSLDAVGGSIPDKFVSVGSGSPFCYGVLEDNYHDGLNSAEGVDLAIRSVVAAMKRDAASGDGVDIAVISQKEFKLLTEDEVKKRMTKLKLDQN